MLREIIITLFIQLSINMIVFPFKTTYVNKNGNINKDSKEYNSTHFGRDNFDMPLFTEIKLGNPSQSLKIILSSEICGSLKIGQSVNCIYSDDYLSYYNRNISGDFNFTDQFNGTDPDFKNQPAGKTAEDTIYAYSDIKLENLTQYKGIGFFLGTDTNEKLCGTIGFEKDDNLCYKIVNITKYLKEKNYIDNYKFIIKYNSTNEGQYIIGSELKDIIDNYDENKTFIRKVKVGNGVRIWEINITGIKEGNKNELIENETIASFHNDLSLIMGSKEYRDYITINGTFKDYINKNICSLNVFDKDPTYYFREKYQIIECDKEKFGLDDIKKFPKLIIYTREYDGTLNEFSFDYKDLFTETKYKYFYNIIFDKFGYEKWQFGKMLLRKYPINFNDDGPTIEVYDSFQNNEQPANGGGDKDKTVLYIIIVVVLVIATGVVGYFLGKYINKARKKRANELLDDNFEYNSEITRESKQDNPDS